MKTTKVYSEKELTKLYPELEQQIADNIFQIRSYRKNGKDKVIVRILNMEKFGLSMSLIVRIVQGQFQGTHPMDILFNISPHGTGLEISTK